MNVAKRFNKSLALAWYVREKYVVVQESDSWTTTFCQQGFCHFGCLLFINCRSYHTLQWTKQGMYVQAVSCCYGVNCSIQPNPCWFYILKHIQIIMVNLASCMKVQILLTRIYTLSSKDVVRMEIAVNWRRRLLYHSVTTFTPKILKVILLTVCYKIRLKLVWRVWYWIK